MDSRDLRLGMDRAISRRDFLNGVGIAVGASLLPACAKNGEPTTEVPAAYYPPAAISTLITLESQETGLPAHSIRRATSRWQYRFRRH